jgi:hypothetical protein
MPHYNSVLLEVMIKPFSLSSGTMSKHTVPTLLSPSKSSEISQKTFPSEKTILHPEDFRAIMNYHKRERINKR